MSSENLEMLMSSMGEVRLKASYLDTLLKGNKLNLSKVVSINYGVDVAIDNLSQASLTLINVIYQIEDLEPTDESAFLEPNDFEKSYRVIDARNLLLEIDKIRSLIKKINLQIDTLDSSLSDILSNLARLINMLNILKYSINVFRRAESVSLAYDPKGEIFTLDEIISLLIHENYENIDLSNLPELQVDEYEIAKKQYLKTLCNFNELSRMLYEIYCRARYIYEGLFGQSTFYSHCGISSDVIERLSQPDFEYKKNTILLYQKIIRSIVKHIRENCKGRAVKEIIPKKYKFPEDRNDYIELSMYLKRIPFYTDNIRKSKSYNKMKLTNDVEFVMLPLIMYSYIPNQRKMVKVAKGLIRLY